MKILSVFTNSLKLFFLLLISIISFYKSSFAQERKKLTIEEYKIIHDSLLSKKQLLNEITSLTKTEIDSLTNFSKLLDAKLTSCASELTSLKRKLYTKKFGKEIAERILASRIWKSMNEEMLRASWGEPDKVTQNIEKWGKFRQLYYGDITFFFRDDKLISWEEKGKKSKVETFLLH
ncbi:hypothetical protein ABRY23_06980 [Melioribacteraceae bacterium 4301-Me]|uniref:hypothetical protein n=1 Tax=Pyranulibacter aquaticus TaxID=3163344 RepID=UPI0035954D81